MVVPQALGNVQNDFFPGNPFKPFHKNIFPRQGPSKKFSLSYFFLGEGLSNFSPWRRAFKLVFLPGEGHSFFFPGDGLQIFCFPREGPPIFFSISQIILWSSPKVPQGLFTAPYPQSLPLLGDLDFITLFLKGQAKQNVNLFYICGFMIADGILLSSS